MNSFTATWKTPRLKIQIRRAPHRRRAMAMALACVQAWGPSARVFLPTLA